MSAVAIHEALRGVIRMNDREQAPQAHAPGARWLAAAPRWGYAARSVALGLSLSWLVSVGVACTASHPASEPPPAAPVREAAVSREAAPVTTTPAVAAPARPPRPLRVSFVGKTIQQLPLTVAQETGMLTAEGLELEITYTSSATVGTAAAMNGEIDLLSGMGPGVRGALQGLPMRAVVAGELGTSYSLMARPEVQRLADLRGGKVGTSGIGSGDYHVLVDLFRRQGFDPQNDVALLAIGGTTTRFTALANGAIDAGLLSPPASIYAERQGMRSLADPRDLLPYPSMGLTTTEERLTVDRALIKSAIRAYVKGLQQIHTDQATTVAVIGELLEMDRETALSTYDFATATLSRDGTIPDAALRVMAEMERANLGAAADVPLTTGFDFSLVEEVRQELGLVGPRP
jgi:NitT/TauT family transport system substrate-binding protein